MQLMVDKRKTDSGRSGPKKTVVKTKLNSSVDISEIERPNKRRALALENCSKPFAHFA